MDELFTSTPKLDQATNKLALNACFVDGLDVGLFEELVKELQPRLVAIDLDLTEYSRTSGSQIVFNYLKMKVGKVRRDFIEHENTVNRN